MGAPTDDTDPGPIDRYLTKPDLVIDETVEFVGRVIEVDPLEHKENIDAWVFFEDVAGHRVRLTVFPQNDATATMWEEGQWYRLQEADVVEFDQEPALVPSFSFAVTPIEGPTASDESTHTTALGADSSSTDSGLQRQLSPTVADTSLGTPRSELPPGDYIIQGVSPQRLETVPVNVYQLDVSGGLDIDTDPADVTGFAVSVFAKLTHQPVASRGDLQLVTPGVLDQSIEYRPADNTPELVPVYEGTQQLDPALPGDRSTIESLVQSGFRFAVPDTYDYNGIDDIVETEPAIDSGEKFAAHHRFEVGIEVTPTGAVLYRIDPHYRVRSTETLDRFLAESIDLYGLQVEHDTRRYNRPATGTLKGRSEYAYTDHIPELGASIAEFHREHGLADDSVLDAFQTQDPQLVKIDYGNGQDRYQLPQFLRVSPHFDRLEDLDRQFHKTIHYKKGFTHSERLDRIDSFVADLEMIPGLGLTVTPGPSNEGYVATRADEPEANLLFADGYRGRYGKQGLTADQGGVHEPPASFNILCLYPEAYAENSTQFIETVAAGLESIGAPPDSTILESYDLASETDYALVGAEETDAADVALVVVPEPLNLPPGVSDSFDQLKRQLEREGVHSQMARKPTVDEIATRSGVPSDGTFLNICSGLVAKAGGTPWRVAEMPGDVDCFIGLDVTRDSESGQFIGASASVIYKDGTVFASQTHTPQGGEKFTEDDVAQFVRNLLREYVKEHGAQPDHIVIHRDGRVYEDVDAIMDRLSALDATIDIVGIRKTGAPRIAEYASEWEFADKGALFIPRDSGRSPDRAFLATTGPPDFREEFNVGAPRPLQVVRAAGPTDIETLAEQVYWLSEAHVGSVARSCRLPITTEYADKCAAYARKGYVTNDTLVRGAIYV